MSFRFILFRFRAAQWSRRTTKAQRLAGRLKLCNVLLAHSHCSIQRVDSCGGDAIPVVGGRLFSNLADNPSGVIRLPFAPVKPPITIIIVQEGRLAGARADSNSSRVHTLAAERLRYNRVLGMIFSGLPSHLIVDGGVSDLIAWRVWLHFRRPPGALLSRNSSDGKLIAVKRCQEKLVSKLFRSRLELQNRREGFNSS